MSAESTVYDALRTDAGVAALVGTRIYPDAIAEGEALPAIVYSRVATEPTITIDGSIHNERVAMHIECWAMTREAAENIANAAINALLIARRYYNNRGSGYDPEVGAHAATLDVDIWT